MPDFITNSFGGSFFSRYLMKQLAEVLPRRVKRILYVGSALGMLLREKSLDTSIVEKINNKLQLGYGVFSVLFPIYIGCVIWKNLMTNVIELQTGFVPLSKIDARNLSDADCWKVGAYLARRGPPCLQYGSDQLMTADVHDMLTALRKAA